MGVTRELAGETWSEYFDALSKELLKSPGSVVGGPGPPLMEASHLALLALTYNRRDDILEIAAARGRAAPADRPAAHCQSPRARVRGQPDDAGASVDRGRRPNDVGVWSRSSTSRRSPAWR
jgi:hypothetical protein